jgi:hypothetical protein
MAHDGSSFFVPCTVPRGSEPEPIVVWLEGEHDISTDGALCLTLARPPRPSLPRSFIDLSGAY